MAILTGTVGDDFLSGADNAVTDQISGLEGNDTLYGATYDLMIGGAGNDVFVVLGAADINITVRGGAGFDFFLFLADTVFGLTADLNSALVSAQEGGAPMTVSLTSVEGIVGTNGNDFFLGNNQDNYFGTLMGSDTVNGGGGFDVVYGNAGLDGSSDDSGVVADLASGTLIYANSVSLLASIEGVAGGESIDKLLGNAGDNWFWPGLGEDQIVGRSGLDTVCYDSMFALSYGPAGNQIEILGGVSVNLTLGRARKPDGSIDALVGVERVLGSAGEDTLRGSVAADTLMGGGGADGLYGGGGNDHLLGFHEGVHIFPSSRHGEDGADTLDGGAGEDRLAGGSGNDLLIGGTGADRIEGGDGADELYGLLDNSGEDGGLQDAADTLLGGAGNDTLRGNSGNDSLSGEDGSDNIRGDAGNDTIDGGLGYDRVAIRFDELPLTVGVGFSAALIGTADQLVFGDGRGGQDLLLSIEAVVLTGTDFDDTLSGSGGDDYLRGEGGDDLLRGGAGFDVLIFDGATGPVQADLTAQRAFGAEGADTLSGIEGLEGSGFGDSLVGNARNNSLYGVDGNDTLRGLDGNDDIFGGDQSDLLFGGAGRDYIMGGRGEDLLNGGAGNDIISGQDGADTLAGGAGSDAFRFSTFPEAGGVFDTIRDFVVGEDEIVFYTWAYPEIGPRGGLNADSFIAGSEAATAAHRLIFDDQTGRLYYDADGVGGQPQLLVAVITVSGGALTAADVLIS
jgi:Ca2+-binding RTX toxin-like protein